MDSTLIHHYIYNSQLFLKIGEFGNFFDTSSCAFNDRAKVSRQATQLPFILPHAHHNLCPLLIFIICLVKGKEWPPLPLSPLHDLLYVLNFPLTFYSLMIFPLPPLCCCILPISLYLPRLS